MTRCLLAILRGGVFLVPLLPLLCGRRGVVMYPEAALPEWLVPSMFFPDIDFRAFFFRFLIELLLVLWVPLALLDARYRPRWSLPVGALLAFVGVTALADLFGRNLEMSLWSNLERMEGLVGMLHLVGFFLLAGAVLPTRLWWLRWFRVSLAVAVVVAGFGVLQFVRNQGVALPDGVGVLHQANNDPALFRADARLGSHVYLAIYLVFHLFLAALLVVHDRRARPAYLAALPILLFVLVETGSRAAQLGFVAGVVLALVLYLVLDRERHPRRRRLALLGLGAVGLVVGSVLVLALVWPDQLAGIPGLAWYKAFAFSLRYRLMGWGVAVQAFFEHPVLGWGEGNYAYAFAEHYPPAMFPEKQWFDHPHNVFLGWAVAGGAVGLVAYVVLFVSPLWQMWRRGGPARGLGERVALTGLLVAYGLFNSFMLDSLISYVMFFAVLAFVHVTSLPPREASARPAPRLDRGSLGVVALAVLCALTLPRNLAAARCSCALTTALLKAPTVIDGVPQLPIRPALAEHGFDRAEVCEQAALVAIGAHFDRRIPRPAAQALEHLAVSAFLEEAAKPTATLRTLHQLGTLLNRLGRFQEAIRPLERARRMSPNKQIVLFELAGAYFGTGRRDDAMAALRTAWELARKFREAEILYAAGAIRTGDRATATELLEDLYPQEPRGTMPMKIPDTRVVDALQAAGWIQPLVGMYRGLVIEAERNAAAGQELDPLDTEQRYQSLAQAYYQARDDQRAIETLRRGVTLVPAFRERAETWIAQIEKGLPMQAGDPRNR